MNIIEAIIIGIIQGLTEFLPVSSSGHIELMKVVLNTEIDPDKNLLFTVVLHAATALSTIIVFWNEIKQVFVGLFQFKINDSFWFSVKIILSMLPAAFVGFFFEKELDVLFNKNVSLVGFMLLITGLLLFLADKAKNTNKSVGIFNALIIGVAQAIAILPGISRSGATIATSVLLGIDRSQAARFSFLMVVPLILGKIAKDVLDVFTNSQQTQIFTVNEILPFLLGAIAAFVVGIIACKWMISLVKKAKLKYFAFYCFAVGFLALIYAFTF